MSKNLETEQQEPVSETPTGDPEVNAETSAPTEIDLDALRRNAQSVKKKMLKIMVITLGVLAILFFAVMLASYFTKNGNSEVPEYNYTFYPAYEGDILEYGPYLAKNRALNYCENAYGYGLTRAVTDENRSEFDARVLFLERYMQTVIAGDHEAYNALFSEQYYQKNEPMGAFNPQMIYNIHVNYYRTEKDGNDMLYTYKLNYEILRNDGTFRRDIGSESSRLQYITLRESADGTILVDGILTLHKTEKS